MVGMSALPHCIMLYTKRSDSSVKLASFHAKLHHLFKLLCILFQGAFLLIRILLLENRLQDDEAYLNSMHFWTLTRPSSSQQFP